MSTSTFFVSEASVRYLKETALRKVNGVSSSHMSEALASALGFNTHAALRAALAGRPTTEAQKPSNVRLRERLRQLGYPNVPEDLRLLPELDRSYSPFRNYPLRRKKGPRWMLWRNLMVAAINAGLEQRVFGLSPKENWWPNANVGPGGSHIYRFTFDGDLQATASVHETTGDELVIHILINPRDENVDPELRSSGERADAHAGCWLERRLGAWIQGGRIVLSCKKALQPRVAGVAIEPMGYSDQGSFIL